jgi:hypothetical protein
VTGRDRGHQHRKSGGQPGAATDQPPAVAANAVERRIAMHLGRRPVEVSNLGIAHLLTGRQDNQPWVRTE